MWLFAVDKAPIAMLENGKDEPFGGCLLAWWRNAAREEGRGFAWQGEPAVALEGLFVTPYPTPGGGNPVFSPPFYCRPVVLVGRAFGLASATG
jgi:hypothetical protein